MGATAMNGHGHDHGHEGDSAEDRTVHACGAMLSSHIDLLETALTTIINGEGDILDPEKVAYYASACAAASVGLFGTPRHTVKDGDVGEWLTTMMAAFDDFITVAVRPDGVLPELPDAPATVTDAGYLQRHDDHHDAFPAAFYLGMVVWNVRERGLVATETIISAQMSLESLIGIGVIDAADTDDDTDDTDDGDDDDREPDDVTSWASDALEEMLPTVMSVVNDVANGDGGAVTGDQLYLMAQSVACAFAAAAGTPVEEPTFHTKDAWLRQLLGGFDALVSAITSAASSNEYDPLDGNTSINPGDGAVWAGLATPHGDHHAFLTPAWESAVFAHFVTVDGIHAGTTSEAAADMWEAINDCVVGPAPWR